MPRKYVRKTGKHPILDFDNEKRLVTHIRKLEAAGFPVTRDMLRRLAFEFAEKLGVKHHFDQESRRAGHHWLRSFMERHTELSVRQAEGLSLVRAQGLNREEINKMFELLLHILTEHDLLDKPERIFNIDETGVQLNNNPGKVIATKGAKSVHSVTSGEKGETMSVIACCNAAGNFLSPVVIIKGVIRKPEFQDGLPPGSDVYMNKKYAYVNAELFQKWLMHHFVPRKPQD
nr:tigger transposable element-derived protein 6-like [Leptinotarsa decemlineata]